MTVKDSSHVSMGDLSGGQRGSMTWAGVRDSREGVDDEARGVVDEAARKVF